jgi:hypothetical protein
MVTQSMLSSYHSAMVTAIGTPFRFVGVPHLLLLDVLVENLTNLLGTLFGVPFLPVFVVDVGYAKPCLVSLSPLKVTVDAPFISELL